MNRKQNVYLQFTQAAEKRYGYHIYFAFFGTNIRTLRQVTILRNGELVGAYDVSGLPKVELVAEMIGKDLSAMRISGKWKIKVSLRMKCLWQQTYFLCRPSGRNKLEIHKGEVIGFAGLLGSGRTETAELLFGVHGITGGKLEVNGETLSIDNPMTAMQKKIAFCPEDRKVQGIIGDLSVRENIILALQAKDGMFSYIPYKEQVRIADESIKKLQIKVSDPIILSFR